MRGCCKWYLNFFSFGFEKTFLRVFIPFYLSNYLFYYTIKLILGSIVKQEQLKFFNFLKNGVLVTLFYSKVYPISAKNSVL